MSMSTMNKQIKMPFGQETQLFAYETDRFITRATIQVEDCLIGHGMLNPEIPRLQIWEQHPQTNIPFSFALHSIAVHRYSCSPKRDTGIIPKEHKTRSFKLHGSSVAKEACGMHTLPDPKAALQPRLSLLQLLNPRDPL